jgi:hypothetical protein
MGLREDCAVEELRMQGGRAVGQAGGGGQLHQWQRARGQQEEAEEDAEAEGMAHRISIPHGKFNQTFRPLESPTQP